MSRNGSTRKPDDRSHSGSPAEQVLAHAQAGREIVQDFVPLSESLEWPTAGLSWSTVTGRRLGRDDEFEHQRFSLATFVGVNFALLKAYYEQGWEGEAPAEPQSEARREPRPPGGPADRALPVSRTRRRGKPWIHARLLAPKPPMRSTPASATAFGEEAYRRLQEPIQKTRRAAIVLWRRAPPRGVGPASRLHVKSISSRRCSAPLFLERRRCLGYFLPVIRVGAGAEAAVDLHLAWHWMHVVVNGRALSRAMGILRVQPSQTP